MNKRLYALFLAVILIAQSICVVSAVDVEDAEYDHLNKKITTFIKGNLLPVSEETQQPAEQNDSYDYAYEKLLALGILSGGGNQNINSENPLTRLEFLNIIMNCMGTEYAGGMETGFYDVPADHEYSGLINTASAYGIIRGSNGFFRPDEPITYLEAIVMAVRAYGYEFDASDAGGFESGYITAAIKCDLIEGAEKVDYSLPADKKKAYRLVLNMAEKEGASVIHYTETGSYYAKPDYEITMLEHYLGYAYSEGVVSTVGASGLYANTNESNDTVIVNNVRMKGDYAGCIELLGTYSKAWYEPESGEIIYIEVIDKKNDIITIDASDALGLDGGKYRFYKDGREKSVSVTDNPYVIYNGRLASADIENLYTPEQGSVTLINNNGESKYNVIIIESYFDITVGTVNAENKMVYDVNSSEITAVDNKLINEGKSPSGIIKSVQMDEEKNDGVISIVNEQGKEIYIGMLSQNDILTVKKSADDKIIYAYTSSKAVSGKITAVYEEEGNTFVTVNGEKYEVTDKCKTVFGDALIPNSDVVLRINKFGKAAAVAGMLVTDDGMQYGYVIKYLVDEESGDEPQVIIRFLKADGNITSCYLPEKCTIDGSMKKEAAKQKEALDLAIADDISRVIKYKLNEASEITEIDTKYFNQMSEIKETSLKTIREANNSAICYKGNGSFNEQFWIDTNNVVIFAINNAEDDETKKYCVRKSGIFTNGSSYDVSAYTSSDSYVADVVVTLTSSSGEAVSSSQLAILSDIRQVWGDGEMMYEFSAYINGAEKNVKCEAETFEEAELVIGDIIRYDSYDDTVTGIIEKVYDSVKQEFPKNTNTDLNNGYTNKTHNMNSSWRDQNFLVRKGFVYDIKGEYFSFVLTDDISTMATFDPLENLSDLVVTKMNANVSVYKMEDGKLTVTGGSVKDLKPYVDCQNGCNAVIFRSYWMQPQQFIIIERDGE